MKKDNDDENCYREETSPRNTNNKLIEVSTLIILVWDGTSFTTRGGDGGDVYVCRLLMV